MAHHEDSPRPKENSVSLRTRVARLARAMKTRAALLVAASLSAVASAASSLRRPTQPVPAGDRRRKRHAWCPDRDSAAVLSERRADHDHARTGWLDHHLHLRPRLQHQGQLMRLTGDGPADRAPPASQPPAVDRWPRPAIRTGKPGAHNAGRWGRASGERAARPCGCLSARAALRARR